MIDQLLAQAERDLEIAARRREIAQAIAADWDWWRPALTGAVDPAERRETVAEPPARAEPAAPADGSPEAPQALCRQCGEPIPPRKSGGGGRPKVFCSPKCGNTWHAKQANARRKAAKAEAKRTATELELPPEPLPDLEARPFYTGDREDSWLAAQLRPPALPWEKH
jgi:hypothetical protein